VFRSKERKKAQLWNAAKPQKQEEIINQSDEKIAGNRFDI